MKKKYLITLALCAVAAQLAAQVVVKEQKIYPQGFANHYFGVFYHNKSDVYNISGIRVGGGDSIVDVKINPSYASYAVLCKNKKGNSYVTINDCYAINNVIKKIKFQDANATAIAYSSDARQLAVASSDKAVTVYSAINNALIKSVNSSLVPQILAYSDNNYFLVAADDRNMEIWNIGSDRVRKNLTFDSNINDCVFTKDSERLFVLTCDGKLRIYDTKDFSLRNTIDNLGYAMACCPSNDGKYVAVVNNDKRISIVNTFSPAERHFFDDDNGGISNVRMLYNVNDSLNYMIYNDYNNIVFKHATGLSPYYKKMMTEKMKLQQERINQWIERMPGETQEAYEMRVNDNTLAAKKKEAMRVIASELIAEYYNPEEEVGERQYDKANKKMTMHMQLTPMETAGSETAASNKSAQKKYDIYLDVSEEDLLAFSDTGKLEFRNTQYELNDEDEFVLVYAEVYNPVNGKTYIYDTKDQQTATAMENAGLVPIEIMRKQISEDTALKDIKDAIVSTSEISDKTHISVKTDVANKVDADGNANYEYTIYFTYEVEEGFSDRDDFKPGHYHTEESAAAMLMLKIMKKAFDNEFSKYIADGKQVKITIKGTADVSPISRAIRYDGVYGEYFNEPAYKGDELNNISLSRKEGIADNDQLAFARAIGVQNYIEKEVPVFKKMNRDYEYHVEVSKEAGGQFRRISVQYTFFNVTF